MSSNTHPRALPLIKPQADGLGQPTVMNRALAAKYGTRYVHMIVVAIDLDRIYRHLDESAFQSEVLLTEQYLLSNFDPAQELDRALIEDTCLDIMEGYDKADVDLLGAQVPFAVHAAIVHSEWPDAWPVLFAAWKHKKATSEKAQHFKRVIPELAKEYLTLPIEPAPAEPTTRFLKSLTGQT